MKLAVMNFGSPNFVWLANDEELNTVDKADAGDFTTSEILETMWYIRNHVDANSVFQIDPDQKEI